MTIMERLGELQEKKAELEKLVGNDALDDWTDRREHDRHNAPDEGFNHSEGHGNV